MTAITHKLQWAAFRTNIELVERSPLLSRDEKEQIVDDVKAEAHQRFLDADHLGLINIIYPPPLPRALERIGFEPNMSYQDKKALLELPSVNDDDENLEKLDKWLRSGSIKGLSQAWIWRAGEAAVELKDWYPFFVTLTVDPKIVNPRELWKDTKAWRNYIERIADVVMRECGLTNKQRKVASVRDYVQYIGTIEHGKSLVHDHAHVMMWLKEIPKEWKRDPNATRHGKDCTERRCRPLETFWNWCDPLQKPALYFRFLGDPWSKLGHKTPVHEGKGLVLLPPEFTGAYLVKYMRQEEKQWHHRMKATQSIGKTRLLAAINEMPFEYLEQMSIRPPTFDHSHILSTTLGVPNALMKSAAKARIYELTFDQMSFHQLTKQQPKPFLAMRKSVRDGAKPWKYLSEERFNWVQSVLPHEEIVFCEDTWFDALIELKPFWAKSQKKIRAIGGY
jgi:hypothetical protein